MKKKNKIIYWIATLWLSLGMTATGLVQISKGKGEGVFGANLNYPAYFLMILGVWKILGVIVILLPKFPLQKEWAYAGFFFIMTGALLSHIAMGSPVVELFPALLLLVLTVISYYYRPADRRLVSVKL
jgi:hypothetical protein